ncbi:hypothetical protein [Larkinella harenae]
MTIFQKNKSVIAMAASQKAPAVYNEKPVRSKQAKNLVIKNNDWVKRHEEITHVGGLYADMLKKYEWLIRLFFAFTLFVVALLSFMYFGAERTIKFFSSSILGIIIDRILRWKSG